MRSLKALFVAELLAFVVPLLGLLRSEYPPIGGIESREREKEGLPKYMRYDPTAPKLSRRTAGQYDAVVEDGMVRQAMCP